MQALCHFNDATGSLIQMRSVLGVQDSNKSFVEKFLLAQWLKFVKSFQLYGHHFFFAQQSFGTDEDGEIGHEQEYQKDPTL